MIQPQPPESSTATRLAAPGAESAVSEPIRITPAARRWAELWNELRFDRARLLGQAPHIRADRFGPRLELIPQFFDLGRGRRFITVGIKYDAGPGKRRATGSLGMGQFLNLAIADWEVADRLWELLQAGDLGVAFKELAVINGNFDRATKAADRFERDRWIQKVWVLKSRLEDHARERTQDAVERISHRISARPAAKTELLRGGIVMPAAVMEPNPSREAMTRFRINQGMYRDYGYFIDRPVDGTLTVHGVSSSTMFRRAVDLERDITEKWLGPIEVTVDALLALTDGREGAALSRIIEGADATRKLNEVTGQFWAMWKDPMFNANADFEVIMNHERRAEKYMDLHIQRSLRNLLRQAVESIGMYPYPALDRHNFRNKIVDLKDALQRTTSILQMYAQVRTISDFNAARKKKDRLVRGFQDRIRGESALPPEDMVAQA